MKEPKQNPASNQLPAKVEAKSITSKDKRKNGPGCKDGPGANSKRTPETRKLIIDGLRLGMSQEAAAARAGVSESLFYAWRSEDWEFMEDIKKARGELQAELLKRMDAAAEADLAKNWQIMAWKLERMYPEAFGRKFQPVAMVQEHQPGELPGKTYHVAIAPIEAEQQQ
jgi:hypothetical protein